MGGSPAVNLEAIQKTVIDYRGKQQIDESSLLGEK